MIQVYTGVPGAGKTYKMVADLDAFLVKEPNINLIANIRNLKLAHVNFDDLLLECFPDKSLTMPQRIELFFDYDYQRELNDRFGGPLMYVLDECQLYFPRRTSLPNTEAYLQRHRHLGHYLYLATQSSKLINSNIVALIEIEYYAVRRSISLFGEMHYRVKSPQSNQIIKKFAVRPSKKIFNLYKSFESEEITKPKRELLRKLWPLLLLPFGFWLFYDRVLNVEARTERLTGKPAVKSGSVNPDGTSIEPGSDHVKKLQDEIKELKRKLNEVERVFLPIVKVGTQFLTVDPDTHAVVDIKRIPHKVRCTPDGLSCYYDRPVGSGVRNVESPHFPSSMAMSEYEYRSLNPRPPLTNSSTRTFVDPDLVPPKY